MPQIRIDTGALAVRTFRLTGVDTPSFDGSSGVTIELAAGSYTYHQLNTDAQIPFTVADDGTLGVDATYAGYTDGNGTTTLTVRGYPVTIDGRSVPHDLNTYNWCLDDEGNTTLSRSATHQIQLLPLPASGYRFLSPAGAWTAGVFNVSPDGQLEVDPQYARTFVVAGNTLSVTGFPVTIDGRGLPHDLNTYNWCLDDEGNTTLSRSDTRQVNVLPLQSPAYRFLSPAGAWSAGVFNVSPDGAIEVDPALAQTFVVTGTTLTVTGFPVTIDGRSLPHDLNTYNWCLDAQGDSTLSRSATHQVNVLPLQSPAYRFLSPAGAWTAGVFNVSLDGAIEVDPALAQTFVVAGNALTVTGFPVAIDGRSLPHDLNTYNWCLDAQGDTTLSRSTTHQVNVLPLQSSAYRFLSPAGAWTAGAFNVSLDGDIEVDPALAHTFVVTGTTLTVQGFPVTIDGRGLPHDLNTYNWCLDAQGDTTLSRSATHQVNVLPLQSPAYRFLSPAGAWTAGVFNVSPDGQLEVDAQYAATFAVTGNLLTVTGFPVTIDGRGLPHDLNTYNWCLDANGNTTLSRSATHQVNVLPLQSSAYRFLSPAGAWTAGVFNVSPDGQLEADAQYAATFAVTGNLLTVTGFPVTIDGRSLPHDLNTYNWCLDDEGNTTLSRSTTHQVNVLPLQSPAYRFLSPAGAWSAGVFNVSLDGAIEVDPALAQTFVVAGNTLSITGFPVTIDGRNLPHDLNTYNWRLDEDGDTTLSRTTTHQVNVLPLQSPAYRFLSPAGAWTAGVFNLSLDGQIRVDPQYARTFAVSGNTLTVQGFPVTIDGRNLPHDLNTYNWCLDANGNTTLSRSTTHQVNVLPLQSPAYRFLSPAGAWTAGVFNLSLDGQIRVDPQYARTFAASGNTLTVQGFPVTIDGRNLPHDLNTYNWCLDANGNTTLSRSTTHQVNVLPLQSPAYRFLSPAGAWTAGVFNLSPDGQIQVDPQHSRTFVVTPATLTVTGYAITIDGRGLAHDLALNGLSATVPVLTRDQTHTLRLLPLMNSSPYTLTEQPQGTPAYHFVVNGDGTVVLIDPGPIITSPGAEPPQPTGRHVSQLRRDLDAAEIAYDRFDFLVNAGPAQAATYGADRDAALDRLTAARTALTAAAGAEPPLWPDDDPFPVLLWPVRLELRYWPNEHRPIANPSLAIRVVPDDIAVHTFEPELTDTEHQAGQDYWTTVTAAGANDDDRLTAWATILNRLGAARAAWAVEVMHPDLDAAGAPQFPDVGHRDAAWTRPATSLLLPDRFIFRGWRNGTLAFETVGADVPADLAFGPDPDELRGDQPPPFGWSTGAQWMVDFDEAVRVGMGVVVPLDGPDVAFDEIMVLGIADRPAADAAARLARSLQGHLYTRGMTFPPPSTPTNNTPATRSDWTSAPTMRTPEEVADAVAAENPTSGQPAVRLGDALGFTGPALPGQPGRRDMLAAPGSTDRDDEADNSRALQVFEAIQPWVPTVDNARPPGWLSGPDVVDHFIRFVRPRGPLPALRVGRQPYGVLPVTPLAFWAPSESEPVPPNIITRLHALHGFIGRHLPSSTRVGRGPDQDEVLMDLLRRLPDSTRVVVGQVAVDLDLPQQHVLPDQFPTLWWRIDYAIALSARGEQTRIELEGMAESTLEYLNALEAAIAAVTVPGQALDSPPSPVWFDWANNLDDDGRSTIGLFWSLAMQAASTAVFLAFLSMLSKREIELKPAPTQAELDQLPIFSQTIAAAKGQLASMTALTDWAHSDQGAVDRLLAGVIDSQTSRVDAWATSLATARLHTVRTAAPTGIRIGAYGWLVDVRPTPPGVRNSDSGWVMTPSLQHAATAAVLHSGWAAHNDPQAFAVDLTSDRVRGALATLAALREGRTLEELLGYQLERALHDALADDLIAPLRAAYPLPSADPNLAGGAAAAAASAEHGKRLVVDGDAARRGGAAFLAAAHALPVVNGAITFDDGITVPVGHLDLLPAMFAGLDDTVDAMGDVLLAESVHHLVAGSPLRAGLAADTVGKANPVPDRFDVLTTPRSHVTVSHTVALAVAVGAAPGWQRSPRAALDPAAETLARWALGAPGDWTATITTADGARVTLTLADLDVAAIDVVVEAATPLDTSALAARIRVGHGVDGTVAIRRTDGVGAATALPVLAAAVRAVLGTARPAAAPTAPLTPLSAGAPADLADLAQRVQTWWSTTVAPALAAWPDGSADDQAAAITALARAGISGVRFDTPPAVGAALQQRLSGLTLPPGPAPADGDPTAWVATVRDAVTAVVGGWFSAAPTWTDGQPDWSEVGGDLPPDDTSPGDDDVEDWLRTHRDVRPGVTTLCDAVEVIGAVGAGLPAFTVRQRHTSAAPTPLTGWVGRAHPGARSAAHLAALRIGAPGAPTRAMLIVDQWVENIPAAPKPGRHIPDHTAGLGFRFDRPDARAPQALVLATPPDLARGWTLEDLHAAVDETLWWARARPLDGTDLPELRWALG